MGRFLQEGSRWPGAYAEVRSRMHLIMTAAFYPAAWCCLMRQLAFFVGSKGIALHFCNGALGAGALSSLPSIGDTLQGYRDGGSLALRQTLRRHHSFGDSVYIFDSLINRAALLSWIAFSPQLRE